jgi:RecA/RadA recombinase
VSPTPDARVEALLRDLGSRLRRGSAEAARRSAGGRRHPTGLAAVDALLGGGFPAGRLCEIAGPPSSGRTSIAHALLARATGAGEWTACVDAADAFDPTSAEAAGVALERVLWVRPRDVREAARACARLLELRGFTLIALDLAQPGVQPQLPASAWQRLARAAAGSGTSLLVLAQQRVTGVWSELALETRRASACFGGTPALLEGIEVEARVARQREGPARRVASVRLRAASRAA